jgi:hypothetical protein
LEGRYGKVPQEVLLEFRCGVVFQKIKIEKGRGSEWASGSFSKRKTHTSASLFMYLYVNIEKELQNSKIDV